MTAPDAICIHMRPRNKCLHCLEDLIAMPFHVPHLKTYLLEKNYRHDPVLDLWISSEGHWYHLCNDGVLLRVSDTPHHEIDPAPRSTAARS